MNDVQKSCFQDPKMLKMNIMIRSIKRVKNVESFKIWFRHFGMSARLL